MLQQAEQGRRLGGQQPLQPHQQPPQHAQPGPLVVEPARQQLVLDAIDALGDAAHDVHQPGGLGAHQLLQQRHAGARRVALPHGRAQRVHRPQRVGARGDDHMGQHANPQRGNVKGLEGEVEMCVVEHAHQGIVVAFDAGGVRALFECLKKRIGQLGVPLYPAQGLGVGQVEMQPHEGGGVGPLHRPLACWRGGVAMGMQPVRSCGAVQRQGRRAALHEVAAHQTCRVAAVAVVRQRACRVDCHEMGRQKVQGPGQEGGLPSCAASMTV